MAAVVGAAVLSLAAGCGLGSGSKTELVVYNAQHEDLVAAMLKGFAKETGIDVTLRNGSDFELANQIVQEGSASPADVFLTENSPAMTLVSDKGLFAPLDEDTMAQVPAAYVSSKKDWIGFAARSTVLAYNTQSVPKGAAAGVDHGPGRPGVEGPGRHRPVRRRLPGDRQRGASRSRARARPQAWLTGLSPTPRSTATTSRSCPR